MKRIIKLKYFVFLLNFQLMKQIMCARMCACVCEEWPDVYFPTDKRLGYFGF